MSTTREQPVVGWVECKRCLGTGEGLPGESADGHCGYCQDCGGMGRLRSMKKSARKAQGPRSMQRLVGALGEFTDHLGRTKQCRVQYIADGGKTLIVTYYNDEAGRTIKGASIAAWMFRPDERPNDELSDGGRKL